MHRCWTSLWTPTKPWVWAPNCPFEEGEAGASPPTPTPRLPACQLSGTMDTLDTLEGTWGGLLFTAAGAATGSYPHGAHVYQDGTGPSRWCLSQQQQQKKKKARFSGTSHSWCRGATSWGCNQPSSPPPLLSPASTSACLGHLLEQRPDPDPQGKASVLLPSPGVCLRGPPCAHRPWEPER